MRHGLDAAAAALGVLGSHERAARGGVTILMYHRVLPDAECAGYPLPSLVVPESHFRAQVAWLARHTEVRTVGDALRELPGDGAARDAPVTCVTFDDGYHDNADVAAPVLEEHGVRGTFFVTTRFVDGDTALWFDVAALAWSRDRAGCVAAAREEVDTAPAAPRDLAAWMSLLKALPPERRDAIVTRLGAPEPRDRFRAMRWEQVRALHSRGHEIGNHTLTHPILPGLPADALAREIREARAVLEKRLGAEVPGFCYPNGDHDDRTVAAVAEAGHAYACTTRTGLNGPGADRLRLARRMIDPRHVASPGGGPSTLAFRSEVLGFHDRLRAVR